MTKQIGNILSLAAFAVLALLCLAFVAMRVLGLGSFIVTGGSMEPYYQPVSRLLTALHAARGLRDFRAYYFHNCVYETVYGDARLTRSSAIPKSRRARPATRWRSACRPALPN